MSAECVSMAATEEDGCTEDLERGSPSVASLRQSPTVVDPL